MTKSLQRLTRKIGRARIGLALGSGAARGFAHIGVLKVLEAYGIPIDMIAGTSMGAFVGGFYAAGISVVELEKIVLRYQNKHQVRQTIFDLTLPLYGISKGNRLAKLLRSYLGEITFEELSIPFLAVATDMNTGREVILKHGVLWKALRASGSVPVLFEPYYLHGRYFIDGGITNPLPTDILIEHDLDLIISSSVNLSFSPKQDDYHSTLFREGEEISITQRPHQYGIIKMLTRTIGMMSSTNTWNKTQLADINIHPKVSHIDWADFHRGEELLRAGEEAAEEVVPAILAWIHQSYSS